MNQVIDNEIRKVSEMLKTMKLEQILKVQSLIRGMQKEKDE